MKKILTVVLSAGIVIFFGALVWYSYVHKKAAPVEKTKSRKVLLQIPYINKKVALNERVFDPRPWNGIKGANLKLVHQATVTPWGTSLIPDLNVKAFHNGKDIYFKLKYKDKTKNDTISTATFSDGASIMFPLGDSDNVKPESIMMGFQGKVNIWYWRALEDREFWAGKARQEANDELKPPVADLLATGIGTLTPKEEQRVLGRGYRTEDGWEIIFGRGLAVLRPDEDADFAPGKKYLCAFAIWDGEKEERGPRKSISDYIEWRMDSYP